jgi:hypothetical protein
MKREWQPMNEQMLFTMAGSYSKDKMWSEPGENCMSGRAFVLVAFNFQLLLPTENRWPNDVTNEQDEQSLQSPRSSSVQVARDSRA